MNKCMKALVVDDNKVDANLTRDQLVEVGYEVLVRYDAEDAFDHLMSGNEYSILIFDIQMESATGTGSMDGITLAKRVRARGIKTPILFLSGHIDNGNKKLILGIHAVGYLQKPAGISDIASSAMDLISKWQVYAELGEVKGSLDGLTVAVRESMVSKAYLQTHCAHREAQLFAKVWGEPEDGEEGKPLRKVIDDETKPERIYEKARANRFVQIIAGLLVGIGSFLGWVWYNNYQLATSAQAGVIEVKGDIRRISDNMERQTVAIKGIVERLEQPR